MRSQTLNPVAPVTGARNTKDSRRKIGAALWTVQVALALLFLFAGVMKLVMPIEMMTRDAPPFLSGGFLRFIGVAEALGALGLILPGLTRIAPFLTPLAAAGLVVIMVGATALTGSSGGIGAAAVPLVTGLLSAFVAVGRGRLAPIPGRRD